MKNKQFLPVFFASLLIILLFLRLGFFVNESARLEDPDVFVGIYAAYGGIFVVLSILWGWQVDKIAPDKFDLIGGLIALIGGFVIMYWPRG